MSSTSKSTPSVLTPAGWKTESFGFRETFLQLFTQPGHATALTLISIMFHEYAMESARHWPDPGESPTRREVSAAAADLRWLAGYLAAIGREKEQSSLGPVDQALSALTGGGSPPPGRGPPAGGRRAIAFWPLAPAPGGAGGTSACQR